jgi:hypothetical protein
MNNINIIFISISTICFLFSCKESGKQDQNINSDQSTIYHNPLSADDKTSDNNTATIFFSNSIHNFGQINEGDTAVHIFSFKNTGKVPLIISSATGTCGCTVPEWPKNPIDPGQSGEIKVSFNSTGKSGAQDKEVYIVSNSIPNKTVLKIKAFVAVKK